MAQNPRTDEIRTPRTIKEADTAIDFCEEVLRSIDEDLESNKNFDNDRERAEWVARTNVAKKRWAVKRRELLYQRARIEAGEDPLNLEVERLKQELGVKEERIRQLNAALKSVKEKLSAASPDVPEADASPDGAGDRPEG